MDKHAMIQIAFRAIDKKMDYEQLKYSDYMYGKESLTPEVWEFVEECEEIGTKAFKEKYNLD